MLVKKVLDFWISASPIFSYSNSAIDGTMRWVQMTPFFTAQHYYFSRPTRNWLAHYSLLVHSFEPKTFTKYIYIHTVIPCLTWLAFFLKYHVSQNHVIEVTVSKQTWYNLYCKILNHVIEVPLWLEIFSRYRKSR